MSPMHEMEITGIHNKNKATLRRKERVTEREKRLEHAKRLEVRRGRH